jgi:predicted dinucleotide-binding enzyme
MAWNEVIKNNLQFIRDANYEDRRSRHRRRGTNPGMGLTELGHQVKMGSRDPNQGKVKAWVKKAGKKASPGTFSEAAAWEGMENLIRMAGPKNLAGKLVIQTTNPFKHSESGPPMLALGRDDSAGEQIQRWLPDSHLVKAFNIVGYAHMFKPKFHCGPPDMFICGNDARAKQAASELVKAFGWPVIDLGGMEAARYLEPLTMIWVLQAISTKSSNHAFRLLHK